MPDRLNDWGRSLVGLLLGGVVREAERGMDDAHAQRQRRRFVAFAAVRREAGAALGRVKRYRVDEAHSRDGGR
jgi:hypothetical protein